MILQSVAYTPIQFLPTPSARRATWLGRAINGEVLISTHALREEGDVFVSQALADILISTHALREEGDVGPGCMGSLRG